MYLLRTTLSQNIVCEFLPPETSSSKVIILLDGVPTMPGKKKALMTFLAKKGFWVFNPRYRGTWESGGTFLEDEPTQTVADVLDALKKSFTDTWNGNEYKIADPSFFLFGGSFGGPAALLLTKRPDVKKVITVAGVCDWSMKSEDEPMETFPARVRDAFGEGYRVAKGGWEKLGKQGFYDPISSLERVDGAKVLCIHALDDMIVPFASAENFCKKSGAELYVRARGGHLSLSCIKLFFVWYKVKRHIYD